MRYCQKEGCSNKIPATVKIDEKSRNLKNRIYCLECSPFGQHNTRNFSLKSPEISARVCICLTCNKSFLYKRKKGGTTKICNSCMVTKSRQKRKRLAVQYKGGHCILCKYNRCMRALEFHHLDPSEKDFGFSEKGTQKSWEVQKKELDKCVLLCNRCHSEVHDGLIDLNNIGI